MQVERGATRTANQLAKELDLMLHTRPRALLCSEAKPTGNTHVEEGLQDAEMIKYVGVGAGVSPPHIHGKGVIVGGRG